MKFWTSWVGASALLLFLAMGCASEEKDFGDSVARLRPVDPPTFLNSDIANLFGAANFTARLEIQKGMAGAQPAMTGELSGREGSLFFMGDEQRGKRGVSGGLGVLWHAPTKTGYLLNDPLQGYAPLRNANTNALSETSAAGEEIINGERCKKSILTQSGASGEAVPRLIVWRSIEKQDLPIRIQSTNNTQLLTLNLSRVRLQAPPSDMFTLPSGFKAYETTEAMMSELVRRRTDALDARARARRNKFGDSKLDDDPNSFTQDRPTSPY